MNARERARRVMLEVDHDTEDTWPDHVEKMADAASDVWEPLLREMVHAMETYRETPHVLGWTEPLANARVALGMDPTRG